MQGTIMQGTEVACCIAHPCCTPQLYKHLTVGTCFFRGRLGSARWTTELDDARGLFQLKWLWYCIESCPQTFPFCWGWHRCAHTAKDVHLACQLLDLLHSGFVHVNTFFCPETRAQCCRGMGLKSCLLRVLSALTYLTDVLWNCWCSALETSWRSWQSPEEEKPSNNIKSGGKKAQITEPRSLKADFQPPFP